MKRVVVGMSGGVDSAVAAYLLKQEGYEVIGVTLRTFEAEDGGSRCCEIDDARRVANRLGITYYPVNSAKAFRETVIEPFLKDYLSGLTPNPCVYCNRLLKWDRLLFEADALGAEAVATGHYASVVRLENGRVTLKKAAHAKKDQTYMLYRLSQEQLQRTLMPLGTFAKDEVRKIAEEAGLPVASKPDSEEICFVTDGDYAEYIEKNAAEVPGEGNFVDEDGKVLGRHRGIIHYTVGQRKGLGLAFGTPVYVKEIRKDQNEVVLAPEESLYSREILCRDVSFMSIPGLEEGESLACTAKIRYQHPGEKAEIIQERDGLVRILFENPVRAAAPGQSAVFYDGEDRVIGGGVIVSSGAGIRLPESETGEVL